MQVVRTFRQAQHVPQVASPIFGSDFFISTKIISKVREFMQCELIEQRTQICFRVLSSDIQVFRHGLAL
jgi:hypothetical protein